MRCSVRMAVAARLPCQGSRENVALPAAVPRAGGLAAVMDVFGCVRCPVLMAGALAASGAWEILLLTNMLRTAHHPGMHCLTC